MPECGCGMYIPLSYWVSLNSEDREQKWNDAALYEATKEYKKQLHIIEHIKSCKNSPIKEDSNVETS